MMTNLEEFNYTSGSRVIRNFPSYQAFLSKVAQDPGNIRPLFCIMKLFGKYGSTNEKLYALAYFLNINDSGIKVLKKSKAVVHFESVEITKRTKNGTDYIVPTKCSII